jgi:Viral BACON domain
LLLTILHALAALLVAGAWDAFAQTPSEASLTRWDIHAATGGSDAAEGTHKLSGIARDSRGDVWVIGQGAGHVRVGRIEASRPGAESYTEWRVFKYGEDGEPRGLLLTPNDDVWLAVAGTVPFVRKLADSNTFIDFRRDAGLVFSPTAMVLGHDGSRIYVAGAEQNGQGYIVTIDATLAAGPDDVKLPAWTAPASERASFQPQYVALDAMPGVVWFTNSGDPLNPQSSVARLDVATGHLLAWPVKGVAAAGLQVSGSRVCVVTRGSFAQPPAPPGDVECLYIPEDNPATPDNEMATVPATRRRFNRHAAGALDLPEQIVIGGADSLFVTEKGGNAVVFISGAAMADVVEDAAPPASSQLEPAELGGFRVQDDWEGANQPRLNVPLPSTPISITGTSIGTGQARFEFFSAPQETLELLLRHPHPAAITPVFFPDGDGSYGTTYVAESFHDLRGQTYLAGRVDKFELRTPFIKVTDASGNRVSAVNLSASTEDTTAPTAQLTIGNGGPGSLDWVASIEATGFAVTITPAASGVVSETQWATITLTPTIPAAGGRYTGTLTVSSPTAPQPVVIPITYTVTARAALTADRAQLTFTTNRFLAPSSTVRLTNAPYARAVTWAASGPSWLTIGPGSGTIAGGQDLDVAIAVDPATLPVDVAQTADVTFFDAANPSAAHTRVVVRVTVTVTAPRIVLGQPRLDFPAVPENGTATQTVTLTNTGTGPLNPVIAVTPGATWLGASLADSTPIPPGGSRAFTVVVDTVGLAPGTAHTATLSVSDPAAADLPMHLFQPAQSIVVSLSTKSATPRPSDVVVAPSGLTFDATRWTVCDGAWSGSNPAAQSLTVTNNTDRPVWFLVVASERWLSTAPTWGVVPPRNSRTLSVAADATRLLQGAHTGKVTVYTLTNPSRSRIIDSQVVPVTLNVAPAPARLCVSPLALDFGSLKQNALSAARTITVTNVGDVDLAWSATATASDGTVVLARTGSTLRVAIASGTKKGTQFGRITISTAAQPPQIVNLRWSVTEKKGGGHHDWKDDDDRCHRDHDGDGDHDDDDHNRHRHGDW